MQSDCQFNFLRVSVTGLGRAFTLYEEVHEQHYYANEKVHKNFLKSVAEVLPEGCVPIVITDAGFRNSWFKLVTKMGWDFIGRLRHNTHVALNDHWQSVTSFHSRATTVHRYLGNANVAKVNPINMNIYFVKSKPKNRIKKTKTGKKCQSARTKKYTKNAKAPWVIITSLKHTHCSTKKIIKAYRLRMQIEEAFRDLKHKRSGFRLPESGTKNIMRLENLLLIALLATFAVWLAGQVAIKKEWHFKLQANTVRHKSVLSIAFIGLQVLRD